MPLDPASHPAREAKNKSLHCSVVFDSPVLSRGANAHAVQQVHCLVAGRVSHSCLNTRKFLLGKEPRAAVILSSVKAAAELQHGVNGKTSQIDKLCGLRERSRLGVGPTR